MDIRNLYNEHQQLIKKVNSSIILGPEVCFFTNDVLKVIEKYKKKELFFS